MLNRRRMGEAQQITADRRRREDEAPRLRDEVPHLVTLGLEIDEGRAGRELAGATHIRRIVVEHAPALFVVPCGGSDCKGGAHDITHVIMRALRQGQTRFEGESACDGSTNAAACPCVVRYVGTATYKA